MTDGVPDAATLLSSERKDSVMIPSKVMTAAATVGSTFFVYFDGFLLVCVLRFNPDVRFDL